MISKEGNTLTLMGGDAVWVSSVGAVELRCYDPLPEQATMSVWLRNLQSSVAFNCHLLKLQSTLLLQLLCPGSSKFSVSIVCVDREEIQHLNKVYRRLDQPTDVLSFPYHEVINNCVG